MDRPHAVVFDAFGTLFDVRAADDACEVLFPGRGVELGRRWREKQLQYTWLRSLMGRYEDFERVTADALAAACGPLGLDPDVARRERLNEAYRTLPLHPDVPAGLEALERAGCRLAILSNGAPEQLEAAARHAGLGVRLDLLSADTVRVFKPDPRVYALAEQHFGVGRSRLLFVSANAWDVAGASSYGLRCAWLNRSGIAFEVLGCEPPWTVADLTGLAGRVGAET